MTSSAQPCLDLALICWAELHPGTAAWLQAILTPISVFLAALAILAPGWLQRRQAADALREVLRGAATTAAAGAGTVRLVYQSAQIARDRPTEFHVPRSLLETGARSVRDFPIHTLTDGKAAEAMHAIRLLTDSAVEDAEYLEKFATLGAVPEEFIDMLKDRASTADNAWRILAEMAGAKRDVA